MLSSVHLSSVCLSSVTFVRRTQPAEILGNVLRHLVPWPSIDIRQKIYGDRPRGTPPSEALNTRQVAKYIDFGHCRRLETVQDRR